ncbi:MAG TPA: metallophosphoesterase [Bacteroidales bacterium]|nr:metallophosphoesterase [Bacteroidales bacterium]HSA42251.1 metallophosphoesterase [Bacteroidales bacterium]
MRCLKPAVCTFLLPIWIMFFPMQSIWSQASPAKCRFVFMTDIHLQPEKKAVEGFERAIEEVNRLNPDFVITGGDLIMDALGQTYGRADSLYKLYQSTASKLNMPVHNTLGNHEIYGIFDKAHADPAHPEYGEKMYENRLGKSYYSFTYGDYKFMVLNSVEDTRKNSYVGMIDTVQLDWIKDELAATDTTTPIILSTHIPFVTVYNQIYNSTTRANDSSLVVVNAKEVLDLFARHHLILVLQGHLHTVEDIEVNGTRFITGGAVCGRWWTGPNLGFEEGFLLINLDNGSLNWKYVDYGWEVE